MASTKKDPVLVILQLTGANDYLNTIVPYTNPLYWDNRPKVNIPEDQVLPIDDELAFRSDTEPLKAIYDNGNMAIIHGIGFENSPRSHFRAMDIWHTCEPDRIGIDGWVAKVIRDLDPSAENVLKGVNFGQGLPRALTMRGVPVTSVNHLETYGVFSSVRSSEEERAQLLDSFARMYAPAIGTGPTMEYLGQTGLNALKGADILATAPEKYTSSVEYSATAIGQYMKNIAQTHLAEFGTRVLFTTSPYNGFDTHANQASDHARLWTDVSNTVETFFEDLRDHQASDNVLLFMFSEFGRRIVDNGSGTDHGASSVAFVVGEQVKGGLYGTYPSLEPSEQEEGGNLKSSMDFRSVYTTILEDWMHMDPVPIVGGNYEKIPFL